MQDSSSEAEEKKENGKTKTNGHALPDKVVSDSPQAQTQALPNGTAARDYARLDGPVAVDADKGREAERRATDALSTSEFESELDFGDRVNTVELTRMRLTPLKDVECLPAGTRVAFRARVHHIRALGTLIHYFRSHAMLILTDGTEPMTQARRLYSWSCARS